MGCPTEAELSETIVFSVTTHDPDTGGLADADAAPAYRVYEDETVTPILTGSMAKLDDDNTTGLYSEQLTCSAANGFEAGKTYTILVTAAVGGISAGLTFGFKVMARAAGVWTYTLRTLTHPAAQIPDVVTGADLSIYRGDTLGLILTGLADNTDWEKLWFTIKRTKADSDAESMVQIALSNPAAVTDGLLYIAGAASSVKTNGSLAVLSTTSVSISLEAVETAKLEVRAGYWDIQMLEGDTVTTLAAGKVTVTGDVSRAVG